MAIWSAGARLWGRPYNAVLSTVLRVCVFALIAASAGLVTTVGASSETRSLKLYYIHTKEKAEIVFKRNGKYDQAGLTKLNRFLRDWRRNEPTKMDPRLFDLVWEVYNTVGGRDYINVISAYRSPATNDMLRRTRGGQAKKSQHMVGRAMDFYIPGVKLTALRNAAMKIQGGGVGYYPKSGSPFVHLDVASVRAWPRMSRQELSKLFPDGKTLHLPPDGKPLPGYKVALAEYKRRGGAIVSTSSGNSSSDKKRSGGLLAALFGGGDEDEETEAIAAAPVPKSAPQQTEVAALPGVADASAEAAPPLELAFALPARGPMPVARPSPEPPAVVAALAPPEPVLPAQAEIEAFAAAANAEVATPAPAKIDLASIRAPIPELLAERTQAPEPAPETTAVEVAALSTANLPVPNLIEARMPSETVQPAQEVGSAALVSNPAEPSPAVAEMVVSLPSGDDFVPLPIRRPGDRAGDRLPAIEVASLEPAPVQRGARIAATSLSGAASRKGDRPTASTVADQQPRAVRTEPKLTDTMISTWALSQERVNKMSTLPGKGQRFVVNQLRAAPTVVYANAFAPGGDLPHNQFTGSAVNFISVARFGK